MPNTSASFVVGDQVPWGGRWSHPSAPLLPPGVLPLIEMMQALMVPFAKMMTLVLENYNELSQFLLQALS